MTNSHNFKEKVDAITKLIDENYEDEEYQDKFTPEQNDVMKKIIGLSLQPIKLEVDLKKEKYFLLVKGMKKIELDQDNIYNIIDTFATAKIRKTSEGTVQRTYKEVFGSGKKKINVEVQKDNFIRIEIEKQLFDIVKAINPGQNNIDPVYPEKEVAAPKKKDKKVAAPKNLSQLTKEENNDYNVFLSSTKNLKFRGGILPEDLSQLTEEETNDYNAFLLSAKTLAKKKPSLKKKPSPKKKDKKVLELLNNLTKEEIEGDDDSEEENTEEEEEIYEDENAEEEVEVVSRTAKREKVKETKRQKRKKKSIENAHKTLEYWKMLYPDGDGDERSDTGRQYLEDLAQKVGIEVTSFSTQEDVVKHILENWEELVNESNYLSLSEILEIQPRDMKASFSSKLAGNVIEIDSTNKNDMMQKDVMMNAMFAKLQKSGTEEDIPEIVALLRIDTEPVSISDKDLVNELSFHTKAKLPVRLAAEKFERPQKEKLRLRRIDEDENIFDEHGNVVDEHGNVVDEHGKVIDEYEKEGKLKLRRIDEHGNLIDKHGNVIEPGNLIDEHGNVVEYRKVIVEKDRKPISYVSKAKEVFTPPSLPFSYMGKLFEYGHIVSFVREINSEIYSMQGKIVNYSDNALVVYANNREYNVFFDDPTLRFTSNELAELVKKDKKSIQYAKIESEVNASSILNRDKSALTSDLRVHAINHIYHTVSPIVDVPVYLPNEEFQLSVYNAGVPEIGKYRASFWNEWVREKYNGALFYLFSSNYMKSKAAEFKDFISQFNVKPDNYKNNAKDLKNYNNLDFEMIRRPAANYDKIVMSIISEFHDKERFLNYIHYKYIEKVPVSVVNGAMTQVSPVDQSSVWWKNNIDPGRYFKPDFILHDIVINRYVSLEMKFAEKLYAQTHVTIKQTDEEKELRAPTVTKEYNFADEYKLFQYTFDDNEAKMQVLNHAVEYYLNYISANPTEADVKEFDESMEPRITEMFERDSLIYEEVDSYLKYTRGQSKWGNISLIKKLEDKITTTLAPTGLNIDLSAYRTETNLQFLLDSVKFEVLCYTASDTVKDYLHNIFSKLVYLEEPVSKYTKFLQAKIKHRKYTVDQFPSLSIAHLFPEFAMNLFSKGRLTDYSMKLVQTYIRDLEDSLAYNFIESYATKGTIGDIVRSYLFRDFNYIDLATFTVPVKSKCREDGKKGDDIPLQDLAIFYEEKKEKKKGEEKKKDDNKYGMKGGDVPLHDLVICYDQEDDKFSCHSETNIKKHIKKGKPLINPYTQKPFPTRFIKEMKRRTK